MRVIRLLAILATFVVVGIGVVLWFGPEPPWADLSTWDGPYSAGTVYTWNSGTWPMMVVVAVIAGSIAAVLVALLLRPDTRRSAALAVALGALAGLASMWLLDAATGARLGLIGPLLVLFGIIGGVMFHSAPSRPTPD